MRESVNRRSVLRATGALVGVGTIAVAGQSFASEVSDDALLDKYIEAATTSGLSMDLLVGMLHHLPNEVAMVSLEKVIAWPKAPFDPKTFIAASDRLGYVCTAHVRNGALAGFSTAHPENGPPGHCDAYFALIYDAHKTDDYWREIVGEYLVSVGRAF